MVILRRDRILIFIPIYLIFNSSLPDIVLFTPIRPSLGTIKFHVQPNEANESLGSLSVCINDVDDVDSFHPGVQHVRQFPKKCGTRFLHLPGYF